MKKGFATIALVLAIIILFLFGFVVFQQYKASKIIPTPTSLPHVVPKEKEGIVNIVLGLNSIEDLRVTINNKNALLNPVHYVRNHCNWNIYEIALDRGPHVLRVTNVRTQVNAEKNFDLGNTIWFNIYYAFNDSINIEQNTEGWLCE